MKNIETIIRNLVDTKAAQDNQIDLNAYENGMRALAEQLLIADVSGSDMLILLESLNPLLYEVHRGEIRLEKNIVLTTKDKKFAERLVRVYNNYS